MSRSISVPENPALYTGVCRHPHNVRSRHPNGTASDITCDPSEEGGVNQSVCWRN